MKRFKASVIGGSGYGARGAHPPPARRTPTSSSSGWPRSTSSASRSRPRTRTSRGAPISASRGSRPSRRGAQGWTWSSSACPHKVSAQHVPRDHRRPGAQDHRPVGRLPAQGRRPPTRSTTARAHPCAASSLAATFVYGLPELHREAIQQGDARRLAGLLRHHDRARRSCRSRRPGSLDGRRRDRRHHRLERERRRAERGHAPPGARHEPAHLQAARAPAHPGDRADAHGRGRRPASRSTSCR